MRFPPALKHMTYGRFIKYVSPLIEQSCGFNREDYEVVALMREPLSWLNSWYRYRQRFGVSPEKSTVGLTFESFVQDYMRENQPPYAALGNQLSMLRDRDRVGVDRVFPYEDFGEFTDWVSARIGKKFELPTVNESRKTSTELSEETMSRLRTHLSGPVAFHSLLSADGQILDRHHSLICEQFGCEGN